MMNVRLLHLFWVSLFMVGLSQAARGDLPQAGQALPVVTYTVGDGLPSSHILDLDQDREGRLWILNRLGVACFDGNSFEPFSEDLVSTRLGALTIDRSGQIWVAFGWGKPQIYRMVEDGWHLLPELPDLPFSDAPVFLEAIEGNDQESDSGQTLVVLASATGRLWLWSAQKDPSRTGVVDKPRLLETSEPSPAIHALERAHLQGQEQIAVAGESGLCFILPSGQLDCSAAEKEPRLATPIYALAEQQIPSEPKTDGSRSRLWMLGRNAELPDSASYWLGYLEQGQLEVVAESLSLPSLEVNTRVADDYSMSMTLDAAGGLYFGNAAALFYFDPVTLTAPELGIEHGLRGAGTTALLTAREGGVWVGRLGSLDRIGSRRFRTFDREDGLLENEVTAIVEPSPGKLVLGHNLGLTFMEGEEMTTLEFDRDPEMGRNAYRVFNMVSDPEGVIWLATYEAGLLRVAPDHRVTVELPELPFPRAFAHDPEGRLWVAGTTGLFVQTSEGFELGFRPEGLDNVRDLAIDAQGNIFVSTEDGLLTCRQGEWSIARAPGPKHNNLFGLLVLPSGEVWVGTVAGPVRLHNDKLVPIDGFPTLAVPVFFLFQDPEGRIWLGTNDGVRIWDDSRLRHLSVRQGLAGRETNRGAGFVDHAGAVWVGTGLGLSTYRRRHDRELPAPGLVLGEVEVEGQTYPMSEALLFGYRQNALTFRFKAISLSRESDLQVRWRLEGLEASPGEAVSNPPSEVRYSHLAPGNYRFRVQAGWSDGAWGREAVSMPITIQQPFWHAPVFRGLVVMALLGLAFGGHLLHVRVMRHRASELQGINDQLQQAAAERERLIANLEAQNIELERFNYTVSHDLKGPLVSIRGFTGFVRQALAEGRLEQATEDLARIDDAAAHMTRLLKELFNLAHIGESVHRSKRVPLEELVWEVREQLQVEFERRGAELKTSLGEAAVWGDRERLRILLRQLLDNAIKFNRATVPVVTVEAQEEPDRLLISVTDNGIGIPLEFREQIFGLFKRLDVSYSGTGVGLTLVARIVEAHGGEVWAESGPGGQGARFVVSLPLRPQLRAAELGADRSSP